MIELKTPCTSEDIEKLKCGDVVKISGVLYTGRDQAHKRMVAALKEGKELPYCISITRFTFAFSSGVRFGSVMFNTPSLTFALILSFSTSSGKTRACWNLA